MRCPEIVLGILNDCTRVDNYYASAFRAFIDARRILRKCSCRHQTFIDTSCLYTGTDLINGPVHGLYHYANNLGILFTIESGVIMLSTPPGAKLPLCTPHETHFKACIRESCRHALITHLVSRLKFEETRAAAAIAAASKNPAGKKSKVKLPRDDMLGIQPYVDLDATVALSKGGKNASHAFTASELAGTAHDDDASVICKPCKLDCKTMRRWQTIIAGSIRAPHRLKHTGRISDHRCPHPG